MPTSFQKNIKISYQNQEKKIKNNSFYKKYATPIFLANPKPTFANKISKES